MIMVIYGHDAGVEGRFLSGVETERFVCGDRT